MVDKDPISVQLLTITQKGSYEYITNNVDLLG